jgi:hypothetical protein
MEIMEKYETYWIDMKVLEKEKFGKIEKGRKFKKFGK